MPPAKIKEIAGLAANVYKDHSEAISTYLAHCTKDRYMRPRSWRPGKMYGELAEALSRFEALIDESEATARAVPVSVLEDDFGTATRTRFNSFAGFMDEPRK
jgi:hypothetical protein